MKETLLSIAIGITKTIVLALSEGLIGFIIWTYIFKSWINEDIFLIIFLLVVMFIDSKLINFEIIYKNKGEDDNEK